jgi:hypothetical protein
MLENAPEAPGSHAALGNKARYQTTIGKPPCDRFWLKHV